MSHLHVRALVFRERTEMVTCRRSSSRHPVPSNPERCHLPKREKLSTPHPSLAAFLLKGAIHCKERYMPFLAAVTPPFPGRCSPFCVHQTTTRNEESLFIFPSLPLHGWLITSCAPTYTQSKETVLAMVFKKKVFQDFLAVFSVSCQYVFM